MPDSPITPFDRQPHRADRRISRRGLLAIAATIPVAAAIAKASGGISEPAISPLPAAAASSTTETHSGPAFYFC